MNKYVQAYISLALGIVIYGLFAEFDGLELISRLYWSLCGVVVVAVTEKIQSLEEA